MLYLDTSLLVAALTDEPKTVAAQTWLAAQVPGTLATSDWATTEFSAALSIKLRTAQITSVERGEALSGFARLTIESLVVLSISRPKFLTAARFADNYPLGLRAGDALHLAVSANHGATLCTLDRRLAASGTALGVKTLLL